MKKLYSVLALSILLGASVVSSGEDMSHHGQLMISDAWSRVTAPGAKVGGGYVTITNGGEQVERLLTVSADHSERAEIHSMSMQDDVMVMRPLDDALTIPAGETVHLEPGGLHLMFLQLNQPHVVNQPFDVTLTFENAGEIVVSFDVLSMRDSMERTAASEGHGAMKHDETKGKHDH